MEDAHDPNTRVFVVWEPVLPTDWTAPANGALARISDPRAMQFWDKEKLLSQKIVQAARTDPRAIIGEDRLPGKEVIWDFVAVYPPGVRWNGAYPAAKFAGRPVVDVMTEFRQTLPR